MDSTGRWKALRSDENASAINPSRDIQPSWLVYLRNIRSSYACAELTIKRQ